MLIKRIPKKIAPVFVMIFLTLIVSSSQTKALKVEKSFDCQVARNSITIGAKYVTEKGIYTNLQIASLQGSSSFWVDKSNKFDFNDPGGCLDEDKDGVGGKTSFRLEKKNVDTNKQCVISYPETQLSFSSVAGNSINILSSVQNTALCEINIRELEFVSRVPADIPEGVYKLDLSLTLNAI